MKTIARNRSAVFLAGLIVAAHWTHLMIRQGTHGQRSQSRRYSYYSGAERGRASVTLRMTD
jgi:hypothetical protein